MLTGTVKQYVSDRGFAWVRRDDGGRDVFLHVNECAFEPRAGMRLSFDVYDTGRGPRACNVEALP